MKYPNAKVSKVRQVWRHMWRATKENVAISKEIEVIKSDTTNTKLEDIMEQLDKLTTMVRVLQKEQCCN